MRKFLIKSLKQLLVPMIVAIVTLSGTLFTEQYVRKNETPVIKKDIISTDLSGLNQDLKKQITIVPITYSLQNLSQSTAQHLTVFINTDSLLPVEDLKFSEDSEEHQLSMADTHEIRVNVPSIRPNGRLSFQILIPASFKITFKELSENAQFVTSTDEANKQTGKIPMIGWLMIAFGILIYIPVLGILIYLFLQASKIWQTMDTQPISPEIRKRLIIFIVALYIYNNLILGSLSLLQGFLPLPRIDFDELISMFGLYLIITRYKLLEEWISTMIARNKTSQKDESL